MRTFLLLALAAQGAFGQALSAFDISNPNKAKCFKTVDEMVANPDDVVSLEDVDTALTVMYVSPENFLTSVNTNVQLLGAILKEDVQSFNKYVNKRQPDSVTGMEFLSIYKIKKLISVDSQSALPINLRTLVETLHPAYVTMKSSRDINFKHLDKEELLEDIRIGDCQVKNTIKAFASQKVDDKTFLKTLAPHQSFRKIFGEKIKVSSCISQIAFLIATFPYEWARTATFGGDGGGPVGGEIDPFKTHSAVLWHAHGGSDAAADYTSTSGSNCKAPWFGYFGQLEQVQCCYGQHPQKAAMRSGVTLAGKVMCPYGCPGCSYCVSSSTSSYISQYKAANNNANPPAATCKINEGTGSGSVDENVAVGHCVAGFAIVDTPDVNTRVFVNAYSAGGSPTTLYTLHGMSPNCLPDDLAAYKGSELEEFYSFNLAEKYMTEICTGNSKAFCQSSSGPSPAPAPSGKGKRG